eukprot:TRINITY_DN65758_c9_g9_i1.p1 TRINITY_DN65758_c9_g9~~TRINITY_DN65758_c9_g9_i1.p1  ORF type:complete len:467 (-),score=198.10 TRINITY_DN65758_c9_g9_i1:742-2142(-)
MWSFWIKLLWLLPIGSVVCELLMSRAMYKWAFGPVYNSRVDLEEVVNRYEDTWPLVQVHMYAGAAWSVLAAMQLWTSFRRAYPAVHRWTGRVAVPMAMVSALTLVVMLFRQVGFSMLTLTCAAFFGLWMTFCVLRGWAEARAKRWAYHKAWMFRAFAMGLATGMIRVTYVSSVHLLPIVRGRPFVQHERRELFGNCFWVSWTGLAVLAEIYIDRHIDFPKTKDNATPPTVTVSTAGQLFAAVLFSLPLLTGLPQVLLSPQQIEAFVTKHANQAIAADVTSGLTRYNSFTGIPVVHVHIAAGILWMILGAHQLWTPWRREHKVLHRWAGRLAVPTVTLSMVMLFTMAYTGTILSWGGATVSVAFGTWMLVCVLRGWATARDQNWSQHKLWMTRCYVAGLGTGWTRVVLFTALALWPVELDERGTKTLFSGALWFGWVSLCGGAELTIFRQYYHRPAADDKKKKKKTN